LFGDTISPAESWRVAEGMAMPLSTTVDVVEACWLKPGPTLGPPLFEWLGFAVVEVAAALLEVDKGSGGL